MVENKEFEKKECPASAFGACKLCTSMLQVKNGEKCPIGVTIDIMFTATKEVSKKLMLCPRILPAQRKLPYLKDLSLALSKEEKII